jgi:hypothetical protein
MKTKLDKLALGWRDDCIRRFGEKQEALVAAHESYTKQPAADTSFVLTKALEDWNAEVQDANNLVAYITDKQTEYFENRTESWQESDAGSDYSAWKEKIEDIEFETIDDSVDEFDPANYQFDEADMLSEMPESVEDAV